MLSGIASRSAVARRSLASSERSDRPRSSAMCVASTTASSSGWSASAASWTKISSPTCVVIRSPPVLRELQRPPVDVDVAGRSEVPELERRVAERRPQDFLHLLRLALLGQLGHEAARRRTEPRPRQPVEEGDRHREHRGEHNPVDRLGDVLRDQEGDDRLDDREPDQDGCCNEDGEERPSERGRRPPPALHESHEHRCGKRTHDDRVADEDRVRDRLVREDRDEVVRARAVPGARVACEFALVEEERERRPDDRGGVEGVRDPAVGAGLEPAGRKREQEVRQERREERADEQPDGEDDVVVGRRQGAQGPGEAHEDEEQPGPVLRPLHAREDPARDERQGGRDRERERAELPGGVVARLDEHGGARGAGQREVQIPSAARVLTPASLPVSAPSSPFGMKPRDPEAVTSAPNSDASRLDTSTTWVRFPFDVSRDVTSKPSMSGSWTSRRTTSGLSRATHASAEAPSSASPTTSKPSASSSWRAVDRKLGWSSTMRTVGIARMVAKGEARRRTGTRTLVRWGSSTASRARSGRWS